MALVIRPLNTFYNWIGFGHCHWQWQIAHFFCEILSLRRFICWLSFFLWWKSLKISLESPPTMIAMYWICKYACLWFLWRRYIVWIYFSKSLNWENSSITDCPFTTIWPCWILLWESNKSSSSLYNTTATVATLKSHSSSQKCLNEWLANKESLLL